MATNGFHFFSWVEPEEPKHGAEMHLLPNWATEGGKNGLAIHCTKGYWMAPGIIVSRHVFFQAPSRFHVWGKTMYDQAHEAQFCPLRKRPR